MDKDLRDLLRLKAQILGFGSVQDFIRVWAKAEVEGRKLDFDTQEYEPDLLMPKRVK